MLAFLPSHTFPDVYTKSDSMTRYFIGQGVAVTIIKLSHQVTDAGLGSLAAGCPGSTSIDLLHMNITGIGVGSVAAGYPGLTSINLSYCTNIMDCGVDGLVTGGPGSASINLATLQYHGCWFG